jgi:hypothetical protein
MKRQLDVHGNVVARFCPTTWDALIVLRRGAHREASCQVDTIGLDLHKRESQLAIKAEDGTITERRIVTSRERSTSSRLLVLHAVVQLNQTIVKSFDGSQLQGHVTMTPRYQWDAIPNENGGHTDDELVDRPRVKKRGDDLATAHQPDILARLLSKTAHEWADCIVHELHG